MLLSTYVTYVVDSVRLNREYAEICYDICYVIGRDRKLNMEDRTNAILRLTTTRTRKKTQTSVTDGVKT
jgi:hypothetical protein